MLISLIYKSLIKTHAVFRAFRAIYIFVLHMLIFLLDTSDPMIFLQKLPIALFVGISFFYGKNRNI